LLHPRATRHAHRSRGRTPLRIANGVTTAHCKVVD
jgi:hypothetical protein